MKNVEKELKTMNIPNGIFLGYPECCVKAYGDVPKAFVFRASRIKAHCFNAFIPCYEHATALEDGVLTREKLIEEINKNRKCTVPFKEQHTAEEHEEITTQLWQLFTKDA